MNAITTFPATKTEVGLPGVRGLSVLLLVGRDSSTGLVPVQIPHHPEAEKIVQDQVQNLGHVFNRVARDRSATESGMETTLILTIPLDS